MTDDKQNQQNAGQGTAETLRQRAVEVHDTGLDLGEAWKKAWLEERVRQWPAAYGDDLQVVIYGDFEAPKEELHFDSLGITVFPENIKRQSAIFQSALTALKANIRVTEKSVSAVVDAGRRVNILLGSLVVVNWGNTPCGWWSWVTHDTGSGVLMPFHHPVLAQVIGKVNELRPEVRHKFESAFYWVREPRHLLKNFYRRDLLRVYSGYWNAFECLVDAVVIMFPQSKASPTEKQRMIDEFFRQRDEGLTPGTIQEAYLQIVNPGFVGKASYALRTCFPTEGEQYVRECFKAGSASLYDIRNAINHGDVDAENPEELVRIEQKLTRLWMIVWRMFGSTLPFSAPAEDVPTVETGR